jgi:hypothetical protein
VELERVLDFDGPGLRLSGIMAGAKRAKQVYVNDQTLETQKNIAEEAVAAEQGEAPESVPQGVSERRDLTHDGRGSARRCGGLHRSSGGSGGHRRCEFGEYLINWSGVDRGDVRFTAATTDTAAVAAEPAESAADTTVAVAVAVTAVVVPAAEGDVAGRWEHA